MTGRGDDTASRSRRTVGKIAAAVVLVATFGFWVWAFSPWARRDNPDRLADRGFAAAAEQVCAATQAEMTGLPSAREAETPRQRAAQVEAGTVEVEAMVEALGELASTVASYEERQLLTRWLADWNQYVTDRRAHVERLRAADDETRDRDLAFVISAIGRGGSYTERLDGFARVNDMDSCVVPGDV